MTKTYATATQLYYMPGRKNCIKTFLSKCATCQKFSGSQARTPVKGTAPSAAEFLMNNLGMDLFDAAGKKWLAVVCQFSGYAWLSLLKKTTTAYILQTLDSLFTEYGGLESVRERQEYSGSILPRGVKGPHHPHRKQWIPLYRNPPGNRRGNAHLPHDTRAPSLLSKDGQKSPFETPTFPRCNEEEGRGASSTVRRGVYSGLGASGSNRSSIDFRRSRVENWILQRAMYATKLPNQAGSLSQATGSVL